MTLRSKLTSGDTPEKTYRDLRNWLVDPTHTVDWESAQIPCIALRDGERVGDCDACRLEPTANAVASTAFYLRTANPEKAVDVLRSTSAAFDEGCHSQDSPDRFEKWLVFNVLPRACRCEPID